MSYNLTDIIGRLAQWLKNEQVRDDQTLTIAGRHAVERAAAMWCLDVYDPKKADRSARADSNRKTIDTFIRSDLGWSWEPPYAGDGSFEWCGAFAAYCWPRIKPELRKTYFASTYRLDRYARYQSVNGEKNTGSGRLIADLNEHTTELPWQPRPGDILTIGPSGSGYGKHICLIESVEGDIISTIEGNGTGLGPDFKRRQGVVRGKRAIGMSGMRTLQTTWHARRIIRPSACDLV